MLCFGPATLAFAVFPELPSGMAMMDRQVLRALFRSAGGASWKLKAGWDTDAELSQWAGVKVNEQGRVVQLRLNNNNLQGALLRRIDSCVCPLMQAAVD